MKRWMLRILLLLILGAIVNVAVAWGCAALLPIESFVFGRDLATSEQVAWWARHRPVTVYAHPEGMLGVMEFANAGTTHDRLYTFDDSPNAVIAKRVRAGWPRLALEGAVWRTGEGATVASYEVLSASNPWPVPSIPIWPGFAINTLFYAAMWFMLFFGFAAARRAVRIRRGRCPKCGYDLRGAPGSSGSAGGGRCPECGWGRAP